MKKSFEVVLIDPLILKPYANNNKKHSRKEVMKMASVIKKVGFDQPIVVDKDMVVIKGHKRRMASIYLQLPKIPVIVRDDLSEEQIMASRIADNVAFNGSTINQEVRNSEIENAYTVSTELATALFGSLSNKKDSIVATDVVGKLPPKQTSIKEKFSPLQSCPKCSHTFVEVV